MSGHSKSLSCQVITTDPAISYSPGTAHGKQIMTAALARTVAQENQVIHSQNQTIQALSLSAKNTRAQLEKQTLTNALQILTAMKVENL